MKKKLLFLWKKIMNREFITYGIAGVLTTAVNMVIFYVFCNVIGMEELMGNTIAWIGAVVFAYLINVVWVFRSRFVSVSNEFLKIVKFFAARVASFLIEQGGIIIFVKWLHFNNMPVKAGLAVVVIIMNYIFSKLYIFNSQDKVSVSE